MEDVENWFNNNNYPAKQQYNELIRSLNEVPMPNFDDEENRISSLEEFFNTFIIPEMQTIRNRMSEIWPWFEENKSLVDLLKKLQFTELNKYLKDRVILNYENEVADNEVPKDTILTEEDVGKVIRYGYSFRWKDTGVKEENYSIFERDVEWFWEKDGTVVGSAFCRYQNDEWVCDEIPNRLPYPHFKIYVTNQMIGCNSTPSRSNFGVAVESYKVTGPLLDFAAHSSEYIDNHEKRIQVVEDGKAEKVHEHEMSDIIDLDVTFDTKADKVHDHEINEVNNLEAALDGKAEKEHGHTDLEAKIETKADKVHDHEISDINNLETTLDGKAEKKHKHEISEIEDLETVMKGDDPPQMSEEVLKSLYA